MADVDDVYYCIKPIFNSVNFGVLIVFFINFINWAFDVSLFNKFNTLFALVTKLLADNNQSKSVIHDYTQLDLMIQVLRIPPVIQYT